MFLLTVLATLLVNGAEKSAISPEQIAYAPNDVKVVGVLRYGETSGPIEYSDTPPYRAFVFEGQGRDQIEVTETGAGQNAFVAVADPALNVIASGTGICPFLCRIGGLTRKHFTSCSKTRSIGRRICLFN